MASTPISFLAGENTILIYPEEKPLKCFLKKSESSTLIKINDVNLPVLLEKIPVALHANLLKKMYPKVVKLSDGNYKLYLSFPLLGGGQNIVDLIKQGNVTESAITQQIKDANLPPNTFSSISVSYCQYNFFGLGNKNAVAITLKPGSSNFNSYLLSLRKMIIGYTPTSHTYNSTALANLILGYQETDEAKQELAFAFNDKRSIYLYISTDGQFFYCQLEDPQTSLLVPFAMASVITIAVLGVVLLRPRKQ